MTMIEGVAERTRASETLAIWHEVDSGFWVGSTDGAFLGSIERLARGRFLARDALNRIVGEYAGLGYARRAVAERAPME
ncbi:hypothetical protein ACFT30_08625 [Microbacterium ureisolvens]|uniref:hypothetical protein n=1 Tax=Microbacterium ureisolvens TaxID=2781186 RepID=UPI00363AD09B